MDKEKLKKIISEYVTKTFGAPPSDKKLEEYLFDFETGPDGFVDFWPDPYGGAYTSTHLRMIADILDTANAEWMSLIPSIS